MEKTDNWKMKTLLLGGLFGAAAGILAAYVLVQRAEREATRPQLSAGEGVKIGLGVLGLVRLVSDLVDKK